MTPNRLDQIRVASPCPVGWESMTGDDRVRFCNLCQLKVYNFAELTRGEADALMRTTEGRICGRLYRRTDGTVITRDCPVGLRAIRRKTARIAGAAFATIISLCSVAFGQKDKGSSCRQQVKIEKKLGQAPADAASITGKILDPMGAVIPGADVKIIARRSGKAWTTKSDDNGSFSVRGLTPGAYDVMIETRGFRKLKVADVKIGGGEIAALETTLLFEAETVTVGIIAATPMIETTTSEIKTVIDAKTIERLPIH
jgi:hypothetical protein